MRRELLATRPGRAVAATLVVLVVGVVAGLVALWPSGERTLQTLIVGTAERATVERVTRVSCPAAQRSPCQVLSARVLTGPDAGSRTQLTLPGTDVAPAVFAGDEIRIVRNDPYGGGGGTTADQATQLGLEAYAFADFERRRPLYILAVLFGVLVIALARVKGVRALVGLGLSLAVVTQFIVPAILDGTSPLLVALVGSLAVMLLTIALAHGTGVTSVAAILGASVSLLATALLAVVFVEAAQITGFSSEEASLLASSQGRNLSLEGLVLAGMIVGALGVLDDVTVSQASTVLALQRVNPAQGIRRLFREGLSVGRDHLSATVNTLVLAYAGAALPLLLIFANQGTSFGDALNRESVAGEVVAMLVGSIGLVLAVPLTTGLAAWLARLLPPQLLPADGHGHHHH